MKNEMSVGTDVSRPFSAIKRREGRDTSVPTRSLFILVGVVLLIAALWSYMAVTASTHETLDQHVYRLGAQLKCPVCQGESVADSTSDRAQEMRAIIRQQIQAGQSDRQIIQYFSDRYGDGIVWSPPWWGFSLLAWLVPIVLLLGGLVLISLTLRDWRLSALDSAIHSVARVPAIVQASSEEDVEFANIEEYELIQYRAQLERELADEDTLFEHPFEHSLKKEEEVQK